ncbi:hypothetical protein ASPWEDRAFT_38468 [Aspergillus wentii DTO 134E9]|uniref:DUF7707 domain-containing protein n=1 Tax=Aspergillus wentii DTO 134E9 TaxID=1073089 RepID=A0A1L9RPG7_ASPWE|nr:uncharacterized protein ASPWEDRAFT_38468 [Aspergillus wentii DTO 134E9]KAI9924135.1 hypothetical protein MW887_007375 [Aspergillus wentii]OJJ36819.1 hypothetical protein ASPWEDRAFT_38468 [Aspergillus wentii DTO 134E9]
MLPSVVLLSTLAASVAASSGNYSLPDSFNVGEVELSTRNSWCTAERNSCPKICGGVAYGNTCDPETLDFTCTCVNGTAADTEPYTNTIPYFVCQANYAQCINAHPDDADGQQECKDNAKCGSKDPSDATSSSTTTSSSSSATSATSTASVTNKDAVTGSTTASSETASSTTNAAGTLRDHSTGLLATALFLAVRLVL